MVPSRHHNLGKKPADSSAWPYTNLQVKRLLVERGELAVGNRQLFSQCNFGADAFAQLIIRKAATKSQAIKPKSCSGKTVDATLETKFILPCPRMPSSRQLAPRRGCFRQASSESWRKRPNGGPIAIELPENYRFLQGVSEDFSAVFGCQIPGRANLAATPLAKITSVF